MNGTDDDPKAEEPERLYPMGTRLTEEEYSDLQELRNVYGGVPSTKALRIAISDALAYHTGKDEEKSPTYKYQEFRDRIAVLEERINSLTQKEGNFLTVNDEGKEGEPSDDENPSPYDLEAITFFKSLDEKGKRYLKDYLKTGNPAAQYIGRKTVIKEILKRVNKICPYTGNRRDAARCKQERRNLLDWLQSNGIL